MKDVAVALYAEGTTDQRFLTEVIRRTARQILKQNGRQDIDVKPVDSISFSNIKMRRDERILQAARRALNYDILIVHADADHRSAERALKERFYPGYLLVQQAKEDVCRYLLPVVPIQMTEAWMLADPEALKAAIGASKRFQESSLPLKARQVEADANPKQTLKLIVRKANAHRSRQQCIEIHALYAPLGRQIDLSRLNAVPSYQQFVHDLTAAFKTLNLLI